MKFYLTLIALILPFIAGAKSNNSLTSANDIINQVRKEIAPDGRQSIFDVKATNAKGVINLSGTVSDSTAKQEIIKLASQQGLRFNDQINVLPYNQWALVSIPVAPIRTKAAHSSELSSQVIMGTPIRILNRDVDNEWFQIQTPDGYLGWVRSNGLVEKNPTEMKDWRNARRAIVNYLNSGYVFTTPEASGARELVNTLPLGSIVEVIDTTTVNGRLKIELPDGSQGYINRKDIRNLDDWASQAFDVNIILDAAHSMNGAPYLWGGTSNNAMDCSGFTKIAYFANGIILMRDASQQALTGTEVAKDDLSAFQPGDLVFFGNPNNGKVDHVALYDYDNNIIHSSGFVHTKSLLPSSPNYFKRPILRVKRIKDKINTTGITAARNHPWYF